MDNKERLKIERQETIEQSPETRSCNFTEVSLGMAEAAAAMEANRCLRCKAERCVSGCPVGVKIPAFVTAVAEGDMARAADILYDANLLPGITGRVCAQENQCESACLRKNTTGSVAIGHLERHVADWARAHRKTVIEVPAPNGKAVAVVGSGPAGLTCAGELARRGYTVTVFEALHTPGGVLVYGIPEFRLPKEIVDEEVRKLQDLGVRIECSVVIGQTYTIRELMTEEGYQAVFIATGAGLPVFQGIPGEHLKGVYSANEYLTRVNLMGAYQGADSATPVINGASVVVAGGGNTAMDAVRTARRMGAEPAVLVYRRSRTEMPARAEEVRHAEEEQVRFEFLSAVVEVLGDQDGWVRAVRCRRMELGEPDASGRRSPVMIEGSDFEIPCSVFIEAIGTGANPLLTRTTPELRLNKRGYIETDEQGMTSIPGVFAGGDIVRGAATVILAMGDGKRAAERIHEYLAPACQKQAC